MGLRDRLQRAVSYDTRVLLFALASGLPAIAVALFLLWRGIFSSNGS